MGLFNRKGSKATSDVDSVTSRASRTTSNLQSPASKKTMNGSSAALPPPTFNAPLPPPPDPNHDPAAYLRSIYAVRERSKYVHDKAKRNQLVHFDVDSSKFEETAAYVVSIIKRDFAPKYHTIPPHGRWQHFEVGGRARIDQLLTSWPSSVDAQERTRRLLDLFLVSVLLDAGAGTQWSYKSKESGKTYRRSEGLAVASLEMFKAGYFSGDPTEPYQVNAAGLTRLSPGQLAIGLQVTDANPIAGLEGRVGLLARLAEALEGSEYFGSSSRPGNLLGVELLTGLPEYRNGGLLIDTGLVTLKAADTKRGIDAYKHNAMVKGQPCMEVVPTFGAEDDVVVEWRALTIGFLDDLLVEVNRMLKLEGSKKLSLAQMLEAGSWKVSRQ
ncbi:hypothetical protein Q9189_006279 [Teloschistes chrysophthalmus]